MSNQIDVLAVMDASELVSVCRCETWNANEMRQARAAVAELLEADLEVDQIEDEVRRAQFAGPRPFSYGTGWESRDAAAEKDRETRHRKAHERRRAALSKITG